MGVMGVFGEIEMNLELFSGEIRPYDSECELWTCLSLELEEGQVGEVMGGGVSRQAPRLFWVPCWVGKLGEF